jgi:hypothetical protein
VVSARLLFTSLPSLFLAVLHFVFYRGILVVPVKYESV